jgi:folate-binding protein YgfZ
MRLAAQDEPVQTHASDLAAEFGTLSSGSGVYSLDRAQISLTGTDRVRWLNGMVTNNVRDLAPGNGVYAFLLNPQGRIQAELYAFNRGENLVVETERAQAETILQLFDRYIIMDDVEVENQTERFAVIGIAGPKSGKVLAAVGLDGQQFQFLQFTDLTWNGSAVTLVRGDHPSVPNYELWVRPQDAEPARKALLEAGAQEIHEDALETFRIASGIPKFGRDIRDRDLPQETAQERALHFSKGCYVGQEIVERIRSRGAVHRTFVGFEIENAAPPVGTRVQHEGKDVGEITSTATVPSKTGDRVLGLGYLRKEFMSGKELTIGDRKVKVAPLPFPGILAG